MPVAMQHYMLLRRNLIYTGIARVPNNCWWWLDRKRLWESRSGTHGAIGDGGIADLIVPARERQLGTKDGGVGLVAIFADSAHSVRAFARQCAPVRLFP